MYALTDYGYDLPPERIAQKPADRRDESRLLVLNRKTGQTSHHVFSEIPELLQPTDVLVVNNTKVIPGRLVGKKDTGGKAEVLILDYEKSTQNWLEGERVFECLIKASKAPKPGSVIVFDEHLKASVLDIHEGIGKLKFIFDQDFESILSRIGQVPLPPYIRRTEGGGRKSEDDPLPDDRQSYQTVYASQNGAIAAPTAGFHFTERLIARLSAKGIQFAEITLHVGYGTFLPVRVSDIREHRMHPERFSISQDAARMIREATAAGRRIVAVGTTSVRTLEYAAAKLRTLTAQSGVCDLFIYPGYQFKIVDAMITNFHLPESTLLMLVSAFAGRETILKTYQEAIDKNYRFYSYGDAMLIV